MASANPVPWIIFIVASRLLVALAYGTSEAITVEFEVGTQEACENLWDHIVVIFDSSHCESGVGLWIGIALGTIPGLDARLNFLLAFTTNSALVWSTAAYIRGIS